MYFIQYVNNFYSTYTKYIHICLKLFLNNKIIVVIKKGNKIQNKIKHCKNILRFLVNKYFQKYKMYVILSNFCTLAIFISKKKKNYLL